MTFLDGGSPIGSAPLSGGSVTFTTPALAAGSHTITVSYGGDGNFNGSTGSLSGNPQVVNAPLSPPLIDATFAPSSIPVNGTTTLTFTITNPSASTALTGVAFSDTLPPGLVITVAMRRRLYRSGRQRPHHSSGERLRPAAPAPPH